jgi:hypothetical protein
MTARLTTPNNWQTSLTQDKVLKNQTFFSFIVEKRNLIGNVRRRMTGE